MKSDYAHCQIVHPRHSPDLEPPFKDMLGATIHNIGFVEECHEGGITIEYIKGGELRRLVIGFTELGAWQEWWSEHEKR